MTTYINADDGIISGVAGLKYGADNSGSLVLQTNGTTAITISSAQVVTFTNAVSFATASFTNLSYTGTLTGGTGVVNIGSGQIYKAAGGNIGFGTTTPSYSLEAYNAANVDQVWNANGTVKLYAQANTSNANGTFGTLTAHPLRLITSGSGKATLDTTGNFTLDSGNLNLAAGYTYGKLFTDTVEEYIFNSRYQNGWNPWVSYTASIATSSRGYKWGIWDNSGTKSEQMRLWNGNFNIGPSYATYSTGINLYNNSTTLSSLNFITINNRGIDTTYNSSYTVGGILFAGFRDVRNPSNIAGIWAQRDPIGGGVSSSGQLIFGTQINGENIGQDSSLPTERMRIDSNGLVGIGTNSPVTALQLGGASNKTLRIDSATGNAAFFGNYNTLTILASNRNPSNGVFVDTSKASSSIFLDANTGVSNITFNTTTLNNTEPSERMRITSAGEVCIGQTSAVYSAKLTIAGGPSNPGTSSTGYALTTSGAYGGGLLFVDGINNWCHYSAGSNLTWAYGTSNGSTSTIMNVTNAGYLSGLSSIYSSGTIKAGNGYFTDGNDQPITIRYIDVGGTYTGAWTSKFGYIGDAGDPAYGYVLLCKAYAGGGAVNYSGFTGYVTRRRGSTGAGLENYICYVSVASAYLANTVGGVNLGQPTWYIVSVTYAGQLYLAVRTDLTSSAPIDIFGSYTANFTPIVVADGAVSGETILKTLS